MSLAIRLRHGFEGFTLDAGFEAPPGVTVLFGRSGSGKSTIIRAVAGLLRPDAGHVSVAGRVLLDTERDIALPPHRRGLGVVFQDGRLFPHMTVRDNLRYGARRRGRPDAAAEARVVEMLGIGPLRDRRPMALSGGEKQRVAIGRALLSDPALILADEPLAALDAERKAEILPYFERLRDEVAVPILYVSHAPGEVARLATTVVALEGGRVLRAGPADEVLADPAVTPTGPGDAGAVISARVVAHHADGLSELDAGGLPLFLPRVPAPVGGALRVRIAAREVLLARERPVGLSALNILPGRVAAIREGTGPGLLVVVETAAGRVLARITARSARDLGLAPGESCHAVVKSLGVAREDVGGG